MKDDKKAIVKDVLTGNVKSVNTSLDVSEGTFLQPVNAIVVEIQSSEGGGVLEGVCSYLADVVVIQLEMDQPLEIVKYSVVNYTDVVEAHIDCLKCFQSIEPVPRQILQKVVAQVQMPD